MKCAICGEPLTFRHFLRHGGLNDGMTWAIAVVAGLAFVAVLVIR